MNDAQLEEMNKALGPGVSRKDKTYAPYCLRCRTTNRMRLLRDGFQSDGCGNVIGFDLTHLRRAPGIFKNKQYPE